MAVLAAACSGGGSAATTTGSIPTVTVLPASGTVQMGGRVYTVAAPGTTLALDDIHVRLHAIRWVRSAGVATPPPGTRGYGVAILTVTNPGPVPRRLSPTQIWLLDPAQQPYLTAARSDALHPLVGRVVGAGRSVTGTLVFPTPRRFAAGSLLVYRFADSTAIARAKHVGIARFGS